MKSLKESLGLAKTNTSIDGMPKNAVGILSHHEEMKLNNLWVDVMKSEEAFLRLSCETGKYCCALKEIQSTEEKLLRQLGDSNVGVHSPKFRQLIDEYLSVIIESKKYSEDSSHTFHEILGTSPDQYRALYEHLNTFRKKRDFLITDIERSQDKLDKLKLKMKRTTDVLVEKEKYQRQFTDTNSKLLQETEKFHNLRINCLQSSVEASVHSQINYYGSVTGEFSKYIHLAKEHQQMKERHYMEEMNSHLNQIKCLTIVDE